MSSNKTDTPHEQILFLAQAESRVQIVKHLFKSGPATQRTLRSELDASRTTVSRSLQSLTEKGWVEKSQNEYRLTRAGRVIAQEFTGMLDTVEATGELEEFYRWFPADLDSPDFFVAADVVVTYPTDAAPCAAAEKQSKILYTADRLRILLPATDLDSTRTITEQVTERGLDVETVVSPDVGALFESDEFKSLVMEMEKSGFSRFYVSQDELLFYLGLIDDGRVQIGLADDEGIPRALLETTDETIRNWATEIYESYRSDARQKVIGEL